MTGGNIYYEYCSSVHRWFGDFKWEIPIDRSCGDQITLTPSITSGYGAARIYNIKLLLCKLSLSIMDDKPVIPSNSGLINKRVLTSSDLTLLLTKNDEVCPDVTVNLESERGDLDTITQPGTFFHGEASAKVETRDQITNAGVSTITSTSDDVTVNAEYTIFS